MKTVSLIVVMCITKVDRNRLNKNEWSDWGSRAVWNIRSVQRNDDH
mgnify:CR=1 FL=1